MPIWKTSAVVDLELSNPIPPPQDLRRYDTAHVVVRLHGRPLGIVRTPISRGALDLAHLFRTFLAHQSWSLAPPLAERALTLGRAPSWPDVRGLLECRPNTLSCTPAVTVVSRFEDAVRGLAYPNLEVRQSGTGSGDIVVFVPDGVRLDAGWIGAAVRGFIADPEVMAVAGLVLPRETATDVGDVFRRRWHRATVSPRTPGPIAIWRPALEQQAIATVLYDPSALAWHASRVVGDPFVDTSPAPAEPVTRRFDLGNTPRSIADATGDGALRVDVSWEGMPIGQVDIRHDGAIVSPFRIHDAIATTLGAEVLDARLRLGPAAVRAILTSELAHHFAAFRSSARRTASCPQWIAPRPAAA